MSKSIENSPQMKSVNVLSYDVSYATLNYKTNIPKQVVDRNEETQTKDSAS